MKRSIITSFITRGSVAAINLLILLLASRLLGSNVWGQVSLLVLNLAMVQAINDMYTGSALVYFIPRSKLSSVYRVGLIWTLSCIFVVNAIFLAFSVGLRDFWVHVLFLSLISTLHAFHNVILLARQDIRAYNFFLLFHPAAVLLGLAFNIYILEIRTVQAFIYAFYFSAGIALTLSSVKVGRLLNTDISAKQNFSAVKIFKNGIINELSNLAHTLSNRFNYYMLETNLVLVGIYASGSSLIESIWIVSSGIPCWISDPNSYQLRSLLNLQDLSRIISQNKPL